MKSALAAATALATIVASPGLAKIVTSSAGGTEVAFPVENVFYTGTPISFDSGNITFSSTNVAFSNPPVSYNAGSVFGWTNGYCFVGGDCTNTVMAGLNDSSGAAEPRDTMTFTFATPVTGVGGIIDWVPYIDGVHTGGIGSVIMQAWDGSTLLQTATLSTNGVDNYTRDSFIGIEMPTAEITSITLTDGYIGMIGGIWFLPASTPEPTTWALMLAGFGGVGAALRSRRRRAAPA